MAKTMKTIHDSRFTNNALFCKAKKLIPGGVNSPVRSFKAVGGSPVFIKKAKAAYLYAKNGRKYIDYCMSWGALILGHAYPELIKKVQLAASKGTSFGAATGLEVEFAERLTRAIPSMDMVRLTSSGTEAVMSAVRLARAYTGRNKIIKFDNAYHGHADYLLTGGFGIPGFLTAHTVILPFNDLESVRKTVEKDKNSIAAIIVEPVAGNSGVVLPEEGFLKGLREITKRYGIVLIFDEVITGFRLSYGGAQGRFRIKPDLTSLGKIIGGGLPIGAFGGSRKIMKLLAPRGKVYQAGTFSGNPLSVTGGIQALDILKRISPYESLEKKTETLCNKLARTAERYGIDLKVTHIASMFSFFFMGGNRNLFKIFFHGMLREGMYFSPSEFEANFLSTAHTSEDLDKTLCAAEKVFKGLSKKGE